MNEECQLTSNVLTVVLIFPFLLPVAVNSYKIKYKKLTQYNLRNKQQWKECTDWSSQTFRLCQMQLRVPH